MKRTLSLDEVFFCLLENFNRLNERDCVRSEEEETTDRHERAQVTQILKQGKQVNMTTHTPTPTPRQACRRVGCAVFSNTAHLCQK